MLGNGGEERTTKTLKNNRKDPVWNEEFMMKLDAAEDMYIRQITFDMYDADHGHSGARPNSSSGSVVLSEQNVNIMLNDIMLIIFFFATVRSCFKFMLYYLSLYTTMYLLT